MNFENAKKKLSSYGQEHILNYYNELNDSERLDILFQIDHIDFSVIDLLKLKINDNTSNIRKEVINPILEVLTIDDININSELYLNTGIKALKSGKIAAILLAGGQGTRLGFDKPKGIFCIGQKKELYIFQCIINNLLKVVKQIGKSIHLCIMTSEKNNDDTINFFKKHNFFGYNSEYVSFFIQNMAPTVDFDGKIYMESKSKISCSPKGNGEWFYALYKSGLLYKLIYQNVEWFNVFSVDNVLQKIADPIFIGAVISKGSQSGSKIISKSVPDEHIGVMCLKNGKPFIIEYNDIPENMITQRNNDGTLVYKYGVILNYLFHINVMKKINFKKMPVHIVKKVIPYMNKNGDFIYPDTPNGYKFETFILDIINMNDDCLPYEVIRNKEFAPIKNAKGIDSVNTARALLKENGIEI